MERDAVFFEEFSIKVTRYERDYGLAGDAFNNTRHGYDRTLDDLATFQSDGESQWSGFAQEQADRLKATLAIHTATFLNTHKLLAQIFADAEAIPEFLASEFPCIDSLKDCHELPSEPTTGIYAVCDELLRIADMAHQEAVKRATPKDAIRIIAVSARRCQKAAYDFIYQANAKLKKLDRVSLREFLKDFDSWAYGERENVLQPEIEYFESLIEEPFKPLYWVQQTTLKRITIGKSSTSTWCEASCLWCKHIVEQICSACEMASVSSDSVYLAGIQRLVAEADIHDLASKIDQEEQEALNAITGTPSAKGMVDDAQSNALHLDDVEVARQKLTGQSLRLFNFLLKSTNFFHFSTLQENNDFWSCSKPELRTVANALERLREKLADMNSVFTLTISERDKRAKLSRMR